MLDLEEDEGYTHYEQAAVMNVDKPAHTSGMYGVSLSEELELQQEVYGWVGWTFGCRCLLHQFACLVSDTRASAITQHLPCKIQSVCRSIGPCHY